MTEYNKEFKESRLKFLFNERHWDSVIQFDEHIDYKNIKTKLTGTKGIDIPGIFQNSVYFIEINNFRDYRIKNKDKLNNIGEELMIETAQKVRDSLACIISAKRNSTNDKELWNNYLSKIIDNRKGIKVILCLETDNIFSKTNSIIQNNIRNRNFVNLAEYKSKLHSKLKWFIAKKANIAILNLNNYRNDLNITVKNLPNYYYYDSIFIIGFCLQTLKQRN